MASASSAPPLRPVSIVVAATLAGGIGMGGALPWSIPADMAFFKAVTSGVKGAGKRNAVVMGRKTWESIPAKFRPLRDRVNVVLSSTLSVGGPEGGLPEGVLVAPSLRAAVRLLSEGPLRDEVETVFVIGGAAAFAEALAGGAGAGASADAIVCDTIYLTRVLSDVACDVFIPPVDDCLYALDELKPRQEDAGVPFQFAVYRNRELHGLQRCIAPFPGVGRGGAGAARHEEWQYLDAIRDIIATGTRRGDRTGVGTISKFGLTSRWTLRDGIFPLLTTKRVFWRGVAEELLWFISGDTNARTLAAKGVHIWDGNGSREFLDKTGLSHREEGDLGPVYGFQWRHFGAAYTDMHADYTGCGVDQLADVVHRIRTNPTDRRIILSAWNPAALRDMALPPCHMFAQFYVAGGELSCAMYQRSGDMGLGVPFNIASYALLTRLLAHVTGLRAGEFVHVVGDAHVYANHEAPLREQLERAPRPFPTLAIVEDAGAPITDLAAFTMQHLRIDGYDPHPPIKMEMAV